MGGAYGFERAMDNLGAVGGRLRAITLVGLIGVQRLTSSPSAAYQDPVWHACDGMMTFGQLTKTRKRGEFQSMTSRATGRNHR